MIYRSGGPRLKSRMMKADHGGLFGRHCQILQLSTQSGALFLMDAMHKTNSSPGRYSPSTFGTPLGAGSLRQPASPSRSSQLFHFLCICYPNDNAPRSFSLGSAQNRSQRASGNQEEKHRAKWVSPEEMQRRRDAHFCTQCGGSGHWRNQCPYLPAHRPGGSQSRPARSRAAQVVEPVPEDDRGETIEMPEN